MRYIGYMLFLAFLLASCSDRSKANSAKKLANMLEPNFAGKADAEKEINELVVKYLDGIGSDSISYKERIQYLTPSYFHKVRANVQHALNSDKATVFKLPLIEMAQVNTLRSSFSQEDLENLTVEAILEKLDKESLSFGSDGVELSLLIFVSPTEAQGNLKSFLSVNTVSFEKVNGVWKIDPMGLSMHQHMRDNKMAEVRKQTVEEYKAELMSSFVKDEKGWIPLSKR